MSKKEVGYVYILTNPSFREDWVKIGMTQNLEERLRSLDNTAIPLPFQTYATLRTAKYQIAEKHVHHYIERFTNLRIRDKREFFNVKPEVALQIFCEVAELLEDAAVILYKDNKPIKTLIPSCPDKLENTEPLKEYPPQQPKRKNLVWLLPYNKKYFDLDGCYKKLGIVYWTQLWKFKAGDTGYIYGSSPESRIRFRFEIVQSDMPYSPVMDIEKDFRKIDEGADETKLYSQLRITGVTKGDELTLPQLKEHGLKGAPMGALILSQEKFKELLSYIENNF